jgi:hypothetical protein
MLSKFCFLVFTILFATRGLTQNVGINNAGAAPHASAMLDVSATNKGLLAPRVALTGKSDLTTIPSPANSLLVYNTAAAGSGSNAVQPGYYYWSGSGWIGISTETTAWQNGGNTLTATGTLGTNSFNSVNMVTNGLVRGSMTGAGEFFWGATSTAATGDLMGAVSNSGYPFALNGYSAFNGAGVYGQINGGNTQFAAVQGEYATSGTFNTAGVRGTNQSATPGTGFRTLTTTGPRVGVIGNTTVGSGQYTFGVHGSMGSTDIRCGAVFGDDFGIAYGALGYYSANLNDYSVYGFGRAYEIGVASGRTINNDQPNTHIGLGIYGGVMGGWIRGLVYGAHVKGEQYGLYVDGKTYTNAPVTELVNTGAGNRVPVYSVSSLTTEIYAKGKATLQNGMARIEFDPAFLQLITNNPEDIVITITPTGASKGLYIEKQDGRGFLVRENDGGSQSVSFNWIALATRKTTCARSIACRF